MMRRDGGSGVEASSSRRVHLRGSKRRVALLVALAASLLAGCEEAQNCFPVGESCTMAGGYSAYFELVAPCCQGQCVRLPPDPTGNQQGTEAVCQ